MDQRKKGTKPPFFINSPRGQPTSREPIMMETRGQRPRQPPIQCWGCKGDKMFRDCSHIAEKVRTVPSPKNKIFLFLCAGNLFPFLANSNMENFFHLWQFQISKFNNCI
jgi:hypothetical protein